MRTARQTALTSTRYAAHYFQALALGAAGSKESVSAVRLIPSSLSVTASFEGFDAPPHITSEQGDASKPANSVPDLETYIIVEGKEKLYPSTADARKKLRSQAAAGKPADAKLKFKVTGNDP